MELIAVTGRVVGVRVAPDPVAHVAGPDRVVPAPAEQHVVSAGKTALDAAFVAGMAGGGGGQRPALVAGHAERGARGEQNARTCHGRCSSEERGHRSSYRRATLGGAVTNRVAGHTDERAPRALARPRRPDLTRPDREIRPVEKD